MIWAEQMQGFPPASSRGFLKPIEQRHIGPNHRIHNGIRLCRMFLKFYHNGDRLSITNFER